MITTNHRGLDAEDEKEIADRKRRLDLLKQEHAKRNGVAHPDKAPALDPGDLDTELPEGMSQEHRIRTGKAKRKGGRPIDPNSISAQVRKLAETEPNLTALVVCERLGLRYDETVAKKVSNVLYKLRAAGKIPARDGKKVEEFPALRARILGEDLRKPDPSHPWRGDKPAAIDVTTAADTQRQLAPPPFTISESEEEDLEDLADVDPVDGPDGGIDFESALGDPELTTIANMFRILKRWDPDARRRIVSYLADRLGPIPQL